MDVRKPPATIGERHYLRRMTQFALFDTAIGFAGIAWNEAGLVACHLPERDTGNSRRSFLRRFPDATEAEIPAHLTATVDGIRALMRGEKADLTGAPLDRRNAGPEREADAEQKARQIERVAVRLPRAQRAPGAGGDRYDSGQGDGDLQQAPLQRRAHDANRSA